MNEILSLTLRSMHQDMSRLDSIGMNLANALTPGYQRQVVSAAPFAQIFNTMAAQTSADVASTASEVIVQTDTRPGTLKSTSQSLDVAITGPGYFEVMTEQGPAYTRQGNFQVDARGRLVTAQGHPVMGKAGEIFLNNATPVIDATGYVYEGVQIGGKFAPAPNSQPIAQLKLVQWDKAENLQRLGAGLVSANTEPTLMRDGEVQLRQGYLENANVSSMHEMVHMIQTLRHFESMQKVAQGYDELLGTAIRKLGDMG